MHYIAYDAPEERESIFINIAKYDNLKCRYDKRHKRYEVYGKKYTKKALKSMDKAFTRLWERNTPLSLDKYAPTVYKYLY